MVSGTDGLWVQFRVTTIPPAASVGTIPQRVLRSIVDDVLVPLDGAIEGLRDPDDLLVEGAVGDDVLRGGVIVGRPDSSSTPPVETPRPPQTVSELAATGLGQVTITEIPDAEFNSLGTILAEFESTIDLGEIPRERQLDAVERIRTAVDFEAMRLRNEVVLRLLNGPGPSAPGRPPAIDTGDLVESIRIVVPEDSVGAAIGTDLEYAKFLEFGTERMAARPFLFPVFERERGQIEGKIERALEPEFFPFMPVQ